MLNVDKPLRFFFAAGAWAGMGIGPTSSSSESSSTVELILLTWRSFSFWPASLRTRFPRTDASGASGESDMEVLQVQTVGTLDSARADCVTGIWPTRNDVSTPSHSDSLAVRHIWLYNGSEADIFCMLISAHPHKWVYNPLITSLDRQKSSIDFKRKTPEQLTTPSLDSLPGTIMVPTTSKV